MRSDLLCCATRSACHGVEPSHAERAPGQCLPACLPMCMRGPDLHGMLPCPARPRPAGMAWRGASQWHTTRGTAHVPRPGAALVKVGATDPSTPEPTTSGTGRVWPAMECCEARRCAAGPAGRLAQPACHLRTTCCMRPYRLSWLLMTLPRLLCVAAASPASLPAAVLRTAKRHAHSHLQASRSPCACTHPCVGVRPDRSRNDADVVPSFTKVAVNRLQAPSSSSWRGQAGTRSG